MKNIKTIIFDLGGVLMDLDKQKNVSKHSKIWDFRILLNIWENTNKRNVHGLGRRDYFCNRISG